MIMLVVDKIKLKIKPYEKLHLIRIQFTKNVQCNERLILIFFVDFLNVHG